MFLGLVEEPEHRREVLAELVFAGLIDVQDRMLHNRSYTTGHKGYRARSTVELGDAIGWDRAHPVLYAGALDMAVGAALVLDLRDGVQRDHGLHRGGPDLRHSLLRHDGA